MSYRWSLIGNWSRRDWLAILGIALTVAFVVGVTTLLVTAGTELTTLAEWGATETHASVFDSVATARTAAPPTAAVFPVTTLTSSSDSMTVVGIPSTNDTTHIDNSVRIPDQPPAGVVHTAANQPFQTTVDRNGTTLTIRPREGQSVFPTSWGIAAAATIDQMGTTGAIVIQDGRGSVGASEEVPIVGVYQFFVTGVEQLISLVWLLAAGASVLVGVVVFTVIRMAIRDRRQTLYVLKSTGVPPFQLLGLIAARATVLTVTGVALGYAIGIVVTNVATNLAIFLGIPLTLDPHLTPAVVSDLLPLLGILGAVGIFAGVLSGWLVVRQTPARVREKTPAGPSQETRSKLVAALSPSLLHPRTVIPTAATLTVFVVFVFVLVSVGGAMSPLANPGNEVLMEANAAHPVASQIQTDYATALRSQGIQASPEILLFEIIDSEPVLARGVNYTAFERLTGASIVRGKPPTTTNEAVVGADLARRTGLDVGETLWLGGSNRAAIDRVTISGVYSADSLYDDQLLVSLAQARSFAMVGPDHAHVIRVSNTESQPPLNNNARTETENQTPGDSPAPSLSIHGLPAHLPTNATVYPTITGRNEQPLANATVLVGDQRHSSDTEGSIGLSFASPGTYTLTARKSGYTSETVTVRATADAPYRPVGTVSISPAKPDVLTRPSANVELHNPWSDSLQFSLVVNGPGEPQRRPVSLTANQTTSVSVQLPVTSVGEHTVTATVNDTVLDETTYAVRGDQRMLQALAASGQVSSGGALGASVRSIFGNLQFLLGTLLGLAALTTVGATTAAFASGVQARRRTIGIHRAVGGTPWQLTRIILSDALRIGVAAATIATAIALGSVGLLNHVAPITFLGVSIYPTPSPLLLLGVVLLSVALALIGAVLAIQSLLRANPIETITGRNIVPNNTSNTTPPTPAKPAHDRRNRSKTSQRHRTRRSQEGNQ